MNFALSSSDLLNVLSRFYPNISKPVSQTSTVTQTVAKASATGTGTIIIGSEPANAEIFIDGKFVGNAPSTLKLSAGAHKIVVKAPGFVDWEREMEVLQDSQVNLKVTLTRQQIK